MRPLSAQPVVTTIIPTYNRPKLLRVAVESLLKQTYADLEIIVIKNGCAPDSETTQYLNDVASSDRRMVIIEYAERQCTPDDPLKITECMNEAMQRVATGELVFLLADDDFLAEDYLEKMVRLFGENPECTSAAGLQVDVDAQGRIIDGAVAAARARNKRLRYVAGHLMVMDVFLSQTPTMWHSSTWIFTIRRDEYIRLGGIHRGEHYSSLCGIVPFGVTGFDETAILYVRHHAGQLNKEQIDFGDDGGHHVVLALRDMKVEERWADRFGEESARRVVAAVVERVYRKMAMHAEGLYRRGSLDAAARQLERCLLVKPDAVEIHRRMGDVFLRKRRVKEAERHYRRCLATGGLEHRVWQMVAIRFLLAQVSALRASRAVRVPGSLAKRLLRRALGGLQAGVG